MEAIKLAAKKREAGKALRALRMSSMVPGVVYGHGLENRNVAVPYNEFVKAYRDAGESSLIDLDLETGIVKVLVKDVQTEPVSGRFSHVDFYEVNLLEKLTTEIPLNYIGEAPAVKELGGTLVKNLESIEVECLPTDLVHQIDVDISGLKVFEQKIRVKDLKVPAGIEIKESPEEAVAFVEAPMTEEQIKALDATATADVTAIKTEAEEKKAAEEAAKATEEAAAAEPKK